MIFPAEVTAFSSLRCFDRVGWVTGRASGLQKAVLIMPVPEDTVLEEVRKRARGSHLTVFHKH